MSKHFNKIKGNNGEQIAVDWLQHGGFEVLKRNYKNKIGEIDIIAKKNECIHFVEVKLRTANGFGAGREAVIVQKQKTIRRVATAYLVENGLWDKVACCFDVIEILDNGARQSIEHIENCF